MAPKINPLYAHYPAEYATLAQAGEDRITESLAQAATTQPAIALQVEGVVFEYRRAALALLQVVAIGAPSDATPEELIAYVDARITKEADTALNNAHARIEPDARFAEQHLKSHFIDLRRRARIGANSMILGS